ncbi:zf-UBP-domain-containing protein [Sporormia fimetaria CBS 119925]|uniref:Zf-UBP-domain-containing protein n=1 Tax=Sporormia fimetaria CBS 119925 TaxID=1340428 RepID=A0A6A6VKV8_9PLEO|nr:zf-UBP-domain-containing protein [Sporormia fimetaria CBS 119925]
MPAYFFHLAIELQSPAATLTPQTDIFRSELPAHSTSWDSIESSWNPPQAPKNPVAPSNRPAAPRRPSQRSIASATTRKLPIRTSRTLPEQSPSPVPSVKPQAQDHHKWVQHTAPKDWRFDSISIVGIDMDSGVGNMNGRPRAKSLKQPAHSTSGGLATKGRFVPYDMKDTEAGWGVVHLYRDGHETPGLYDAPPASGDFDEKDCTTLCILAVPSYMTPSDLLGFVGEQTREDVSHFRLIKTGRENKYMVLMKFREASKARKWRREWNGKTFNSMEPEYCHVVFVKSITFHTSSTIPEPPSFPNLTNDPFTPQPSTRTPTDPTSALTTKPLAPPTPSLIELPTCPVCLERMDETTGLLTILCQHVFHCSCLQKWRGTGCPVCRYTSSSLFPSSSSADDDVEVECAVCGTTQNLWICLICGNTGCGRYDEAHAFKHFEETGHAYAMDLAANTVWDYVGDGYVHRLIQNAGDGKPFSEAPSHEQYSDHGDGHTDGQGGGTGAGVTAYSTDMLPRSKVDAMATEYTYLLTHQLSSQRAYFEEQVKRAVDKASAASDAANDAITQLSTLTSSLSLLETKNKDLESQISSLTRDLERADSASQKAKTLARDLGKQVKEEKTVSESLMTRIRWLEEKQKEKEELVKRLEEEKKELQEQNRDLSFFISGTEKLREVQEKGEVGGEEVREGFLEVGANEKEKGKGRRRRGGK